MYQLMKCAGCLRNPFNVFTSFDIQCSRDNTHDIRHNTIITHDIRHNTDTTQTRTSFPPSVEFMMMHDKLLIAFGDESGECAMETAATSQEGRRRASCLETGRLVRPSSQEKEE